MAQVLKDSSSKLSTFRLSVREILVAILYFALLVAYCRWPVFALFSSHLLGGGGGDANLYFWLVTTFPYNLIEYGWFETNSFYPYQNTLAWSDNFIFPSSIFYFLHRGLGIPEIPSWNCLLLCAQLLNGLSVYVLARFLGASFLSAALLGSLFIVSPYFVEHLGHPQLQFFFFVPLGFYAYLTLLRTLKRGALILLSALVVFSFLTTVYFAISLILICAIHFCLKSFILRERSRDQFGAVAYSSILAALVLLPFVVPYLGVKELFGARGLHEFYYFGISLFAFISSSSLSLWYGATSPLSHNEAHFGWGIVTLLFVFLGAKSLWKLSRVAILAIGFALLLAAPSPSTLLGIPRAERLYCCALFSWISLIFFVISLVRNQSQKWAQSEATLCAVVAAVVLLIALGPLGFSAIGVNGWGVFRAFYEIFPGIDSMRAISRLGLIAILLLALAGMPSLNKFGRGLLLLFPLLLIESRVSSFPLAPLPETPKIFQAVANLPIKDAALLIAPLSGELDGNNRVRSWSEVAQLNSGYLVAFRQLRPLLLNGYSGQRPKTFYDLPRVMQRFPSEAALNKLREFDNLRYLIILGSQIKGFSEPKFLAELAELNIKVIANSEMDFILELPATS